MDSILPALTRSSRLRYITLTALYMAQGIPYGLLIVVVPAYFARQGIEQAAISSYIAVTILPGTLKLLNGPILDRWSFLMKLISLVDHIESVEKPNRYKINR
jgi:PAT family beta-lactamase induction signal transducer AmpG